MQGLLGVRKGRTRKGCFMHSDNTRLSRIMTQFPLLTEFGIYRGSKMTPAESVARLERDRANLLASAATVYQVEDWLLRNIERSKRTNYRHSSYGYKHMVETDPEIGYITNGVFIAAALLAGFTPRFDPSGGPNVQFNMMERSWSKLQQARLQR